MAAVSFSMSRNGLAENVLANGSATVTFAANAPAAGDIEVRLANGVAWTQNEIEEALDILWRALVQRRPADYPV